jgi:hypothetical protein
VARVSDLLGQMVNEGAVCHLRLYQLVCNGREDKRVSAEVRGAFASDAGRFEQHVRKWEAIARDIAAAAPPERHAQAVVNPSALIATCFADTRANGGQIPILSWRDAAGAIQSAFFSPRPVGPYANLLFDYDPAWRVERNLLHERGCGFVKKPSLAIFASGQLGICCLDLNSTATFGALDDFANLREALESVAAKRMFAQLANGVAVGRGCQTCLSTARPLCGDAT